MARAILPTEILFNKSPFQSPFSTRPIDARRPIRQKPKKRFWRRYFAETKAIATIGLAFVGAAIGCLAISALLPGGFA